MYLVTFKKGESIKLYSGKQHFVIKPNDLENFLGNRGRKGNFLPKGYRKVDKVEVISEELLQSSDSLFKSFKTFFNLFV